MAPSIRRAGHKSAAFGLPAAAAGRCVFHLSARAVIVAEVATCRNHPVSQPKKTKLRVYAAHRHGTGT